LSRLAPSPEGEGWGEGDLSAIKATLIPTLLPWEKGFDLMQFTGGIKNKRCLITECVAEYKFRYPSLIKYQLKSFKNNFYSS
jgi:hypothetical protein